MAESTAARTVRDVVCAFCGLGCDDLVVEVEGRAVRPAANVCAEAARLLSRSGTDAVPAAPEAYERARAILAGARAPLFAGLGTDVNGVRAILDLARTTGGVLDHAASDALFRNYASTQRTGWLATTLAEVRNRCDVLLVIGNDPTPAFGRLFERLFPASPLFTGARRVIFLGGEPGARAQAQLAGATVTTIPADDLVAATATLAGVVAGRAGEGPLAEVASALKGAAYAVVTWNAAELDAGDLIAERATAIVDTLNKTTRAGVFPLGGRDNIIGVNQVLLWRLGYPLRTAIRGEISAHDGDLFAADVAMRDADVLVWVSAFRPDPPPARLLDGFKGRVIVIGHPETVFDSEPDVFIPVGTPGIDHAGTVFRMDSIVSLPLGALRVATLPGVAEAVRRIAGG
ncbi:formylmethanofuran dehydrogenase [Ancylobacter terrae]|uniref:formylmethanofuran dehydrogenase n=1 Tax=Ancylobacter sp. sgz301288 TaxID=3342077 RepID=UPI00385EED35